MAKSSDKESFDFAKRMKDMRTAQRTAAQMRQMAQQFQEPSSPPQGIDLHMAAVVDALIADPPKKYTWLNKQEAEVFASLEKHLWPHQKMAVMLTIRNKKTGKPTLNASDVGTGKTRVAAISAATMRFKRILWLTSKTLVKPTVKEINRTGSLAIASGDQTRLWFEMGFPNPTIFYVTNYQVMYRDPFLTLKGPKGPQWDCIIVDECTALKGGANGRPTKIWQETKELCNELFPDAYKMFLSATPAVNHPAEIWAYLNIFQPDKFDNFYKFKNLFCIKDDEGNHIFHAERLLTMLGGMCIRQTVESIKQQFPNYKAPSLDDPDWFNEETIELNIDPDSSVGRAYLQMYEEKMAELDKAGRHVLKPKIILDLILRLRQLLSCGQVFTYYETVRTLDTDKELEQILDGTYDPFDPPVKKTKVEHNVPMEPPYTKHDAIIEKIMELQASSEACVVFSCFNQPLRNLYNELTSIPGFCRVGLFTGETSQDQRDKLLEDFQQGRLDVLLVNKLTGGMGLNLQKSEDWPGGARFALHMDRFWHPAAERQANGRIVRSNTKYPCIAFYFEVANSVDGVMKQIVMAKKDSIESLDAGMIYDSIKRAQLG